MVAAGIVTGSVIISFFLIIRVTLFALVLIVVWFIVVMITVFSRNSSQQFEHLTYNFVSYVYNHSMAVYSLSRLTAVEVWIAQHAWSKVKAGRGEASLE